MNVLRNIIIIALFAFTFFLGWIFGTPSQAHATTYYVDAARPDNSGNGASWATAEKTITAGIGDASTGDTVEISGGVSGQTYTEKASVTLKDLTITGATSSGHNGLVTISGVGIADNTTENSGANVTWINLRITGADSGKYNIRLRDGSTFRQVKVDGGNSHLFQTGTAGQILFDRCFFGHETNNQAMGLSGTGYTANFNYCRFFGQTGSVVVSAGGTCNFNNCDIISNYNNFLTSQSGSQTVNLKNCIFTGNQFASAGYILRQTAGTVGISNSILLPNPVNPYGDAATSGTITQTNILTAPAFFASPLRMGMIAFQVDDAADFTYFKAVRDQADAYGIKIGYLVDGKLAPDNFTWATLKAETLDKGHEVICHAWSAVEESAAKLATALRITHASATVTIATNVTDSDPTKWTGTLALSTGETYTLTNAAYDTIGEIKAAIGALSGYTVATPDAYAEDAKSITLKNVTAQSLAGGYYTQYEPVPFYEIEHVQAKATLEAGLGATVNAFGYPRGTFDGTSKASVKDAGFLIARGAGATGTYRLEHYDIYQSKGTWVSILTNAAALSEADIRKNIDIVLDGIVNAGLSLSIYGHNTGEATVAQWGYIFDETNKYIATGKLKAVTLNQMAGYLRVADAGFLPALTVPSDGVYYTRTFDDTSKSLSLTASSNALRTGTLVTGLHDQTAPAVDYGGYTVTTSPSMGTDQSTDDRLWFDTAVAAGGNGTKNLPYHLIADYDFSGYNLRHSDAGTWIYLKGTAVPPATSGLSEAGPFTATCWPGFSCTWTPTGFISVRSDNKYTIMRSH